MSASVSLLLAAALAAGAPSEVAPGDADAASVAATGNQDLKPVRVGFTKVAPLDPAKRTRPRGIAPNRQFSPLVLITHPDGSQTLTHGAPRTVTMDLNGPAEADAAERPQ